MFILNTGTLEPERTLLPDCDRFDILLSCIFISIISSNQIAFDVSNIRPFYKLKVYIIYD